jgi:peptide/nickel transport system substrate-binding protein
VTRPADRASAGARSRPAWTRLVALALAAPTVLAGCLSLTDPSPSPNAIVAPSVDPSAAARQDGTLVVMAPDPVTRLLPPATNATEALLIDLLYDPLYRLDGSLRPIPVVAEAMPEVSDDGLTWRIPIRDGARFHNGQTVRPADVAFSLRLAASPTCPLGRELCDAIGGHVVGSPVVRPAAVTVTLDEPYSPFLAEGLAQLPILSEDVVKRATSALIGAADRLESERPDEVVQRIAEAQLDERCITDDPPDGCLLTDHREQLESMLRRARVGLPPRAAFTDTSGLFDENGYAGALLDRLYALGLVFGTEAADRQAAALPLLDASATPLGSGAFRLDEIVDDGSRYVLAANRSRAGGDPGLDGIEVVIERDPSVSATRLLTGEADWVLQVGPEQVRTLTGVSGVRIGERPLPVQRGILFNVRPDRVYFDAAARRAFGLCLDREALATQLDPDRPIARDPYRSASWARPEVQPGIRDVEAATDALDAAGWRTGPDGIRARDGVRLASSIAIRPSRADLLAFGYAASEQLAECGIELTVEELDLTGDTMLEQLRWPNDFDTLLLARQLGADPDTDIVAFESSRATTAQNQADANAGGFASELADYLIADARTKLDEAQRTTSYAELQGLLEENMPYWPLWYDSAVSALSSRVRDESGMIDPSRERFAWDVGRWSVRSPTS